MSVHIRLLSNSREAEKGTGTEPSAGFPGALLKLLLLVTVTFSTFQQLSGFFLGGYHLVKKGSCLMFYADFSFQQCSKKVQLRFTEYYHCYCCCRC